MSYIDIYVFKLLVALMFFLCFVKTKFMLFVGIISVPVRTEISDFHRVIPCPKRNTKWQGGARSLKKL
jgi:hypothetical protein